MVKLNKIIVFWDGAFDLYLNSAWSYALVGLSTIAVAAIIVKVATIAGASSIIISGLKHSTQLMGYVVSAELNRGLIIYFKKNNIRTCSILSISSKNPIKQI